MFTGSDISQETLCFVFMIELILITIVEFDGINFSEDRAADNVVDFIVSLGFWGPEHDSSTVHLTAESFLTIKGTNKVGNSDSTGDVVLYNDDL